MYPNGQPDPPMQKPPQLAVTGEPVLLEFGPSGQAYGKGVAVRLAILAPLIAVNFYSAARSDINPGIWWGIIAVAAVIAVGAVLQMVKKVQLTGTSVVVTRILGGPKAIPGQRVAYGILAQAYQQFGAVAAPLLILVDGNRKKLLYLSGQLFAGSDMYALAQAMGLQNFDVITEPVSPKMIDQRHPRVLSFMERRPWAFACIAVGVIIVVVTAVLLAAGV